MKLAIKTLLKELTIVQFLFHISISTKCDLYCLTDILAPQTFTVPLELTFRTRPQSMKQGFSITISFVQSHLSSLARQILIFALLLLNIKPC